MKLLRIIILFTLILSCIVYEAAGQKPGKADTLFIGVVQTFPPLSVLIDSALNHNAMVKFRDLDIDSKETSLKAQRNLWFKNVGIQADGRYGTFDNFSTNLNPGQNPSVLATRSNQFNYGVGAYVKIPIYDMFNHKNEVDLAKLQLGQAESMAEAQRDDLRQTVIRLYNDLMLKQRLLIIKSQNRENSRINMEMGEREFKTGVIPLSEYVRISEIASRAEADYESTKTDFTTAYMVLEEVAGFKFNVTNIE